MYVYEILKSFVMCEFIGTRLSWMSKICMYEDFPREKKKDYFISRKTLWDRLSIRLLVVAVCFDILKSLLCLLAV